MSIRDKADAKEIANLIADPHFNDGVKRWPQDFVDAVHEVRNSYPPRYAIISCLLNNPPMSGFFIGQYLIYIYMTYYIDTYIVFLYIEHIRRTKSVLHAGRGCVLNSK